MMAISVIMCGTTTDGNDTGEADANTDGDSGIEGVVMELLNNNGTVITTTPTDENGVYFFGGLTVDGDGENYQVRVASSNFASGGVLENLESTHEPDGDSDNEGDLVSLSTGTPGNLNQDFGYTETTNQGSIGNLIWEDLNADGDKDAGEAGIAGVTVDLYRDLNGNGVIDPGEPRIGTETTDANGNYLFSNLPYDDYVVEVTDVDGLLNGYWHSLGSQDASTNSGDDSGSGASSTSSFKWR